MCGGDAALACFVAGVVSETKQVTKGVALQTVLLQPLLLLCCCCRLDPA
jgi:hypothetical protein